MTISITIQAAVFVFSILFIILLYYRRDSISSRFIPFSFSAFLLAVVLFVLQDTDYSFNGLFGDYLFRTANIAKFASYNSSVDFIYKNLHAYYPPLYFYILGKLSYLFNISSYMMLKIGLIFIVFIIPFIIKLLWSPIIGSKNSAILVFSLLICQLWFSPYEWLALVIFVPWWIHYIQGVGIGVNQGSKWKTRLVGGVIGAVLVMLYYYWLLIGFLAWVLLRFGRSSSIEDVPHPKKYERIDATWIWGFSILFSLPYWFGMLSDFIKCESWVMFQTRFFGASHIPLHLPFFEPNVRGVILLLGLVYLLLTFKLRSTSRSILGLLLATYVWFFLGHIAALLNHPILSARAYPLVDNLLAFGFLLMLCNPEDIQIFSMMESEGSRRIYLVIGIAATIYLGQSAVDPLIRNEQITKAQTMKYPRRWIDSIDQLIGGDFKNRVILTNESELIAYRPWFGFVSWNAHYSHPASSFKERIDFLEGISKLNDSRIFATAIWLNKYDCIDYIYLERNKSEYIFSFLDDNFPNGTKATKISFSSSLFDSTYFKHESIYNNKLLIPIKSKIKTEIIETKKDDLTKLSTDDLIVLAALRGNLRKHIAWSETELDLEDILSELHSRHSSGTSSLSAAYELYRQTGDTDLFTKFLLTLEHFTEFNILFDEDGIPRLRFLGIETEAVAENRIKVSSYFQVIEKPLLNYLIWIHAKPIDTKTTPEALPIGDFLSWDHWPSIPTIQWATGEIIKDEYIIDAPIGQYEVKLGLWRPDDRRRLMISGHTGKEIARGPIHIR